MSLALINPALGAATIGVVLGLTAFFALGLASRAGLELRAALAWLNDLKWREFARLLSNLLQQRGLSPDEADRKPGDDGFDLLMTRGSARYVVQCKHGRAYQLNAAAVRDLSRVRQMQGAEGAIVITTGRADNEARSIAEANQVEIIDGKTLWSQVRGMLPEADRRLIAQAAEAARNRRLAAVCGVAVLGGVLGFLGMHLLQPSPSTRDPVIAAAPAPRPTPAPAPAAPPAPAPAAAPALPAPSPATPATAEGLIAPEDAETPEAQLEASRRAAQALQEIANLSEAELDRRRLSAAQLVVDSVGGIESAEWPSRSTLVLKVQRERIEDPDGVAADACALLVRYEELRYMRLQLEPANPKDEVRVRWRQCR